MAKGNDVIKSLTEDLWNIHSDRAYEKFLDILICEVVDYVESTPELRNTPTDDMWDYRNEEEDVDDSWDEE
jgi:hypothetical protein